jgi:predicted nucleotidyltransferase
MKIDLKNHSEEIDKIAISLAVHFAKPLYYFTDAKSYSEYIEILKEILQWSLEFYVEYHHKLKSWENFEISQENIYKAVNKNEFLIAWGKDKLKKFTDEYPDNRQ